MKIEHLDTLESTLNGLKMANFKNEDISILTPKKKDLERNILGGATLGANVGAISGTLIGFSIAKDEAV